MSRRGRIAWTVLRTAIGLALFYYVLARTGAAGLRQFFSTPWLIPAIVVLSALGVALESRRLNAVIGSQGVRISPAYGCKLVAVSAFFSLCIPGGTGGDVMKAYYLASSHRGRSVELATVVLVDRICAMFWLLMVILLLAALEAPFVLGNRLVRWLISGAAAAAVVLVAAAAISCSEGLRKSRIYAAILNRLPLRRHIVRVLDALYAFRQHKAALARAALFTVGMHLTLAGIFATAGLVVLPQAPIPTVCLLSLLALFANTLPLTPGGLGVGEAAFTGLFAAAGFHGGAALMIAWRLGMLSVAMAGCLVYIRGVQPLRERGQAGPLAAEEA